MFKFMLSFPVLHRAADSPSEEYVRLLFSVQVSGLVDGEGVSSIDDPPREKLPDMYKERDYHSLPGVRDQDRC